MANMPDWFTLGLGDGARGLIARSADKFPTWHQYQSYLEGYNEGVRRRVPQKYRL